MLKTDNEILQELAEASAGLLYMSESDYPFELVRWEGGKETPEFIRGITNAPANEPIEQVDLDTFLRRHGKLAQLLKDNLANLKVYKVGRINMPVYIVGLSQEGNLLGLSTRVVET